MASMNSLLSSWNFDLLTGSDASGTFIVPDVSNNYHGYAESFLTSSTQFVSKESIKTNKKVSFEYIESKDTIQTLEEDDNKIDLLNKPSSLQLIFENSMYQIISDEMLNVFSTIDAYSFKFAEPYNLYKSDYNKLEEIRHNFFSKIVDKPNLEKYLEFYKWLDSSLGYMLDQLKPESSNNIKSLKNTIESHLLERNKYQYKLPLTIKKDNNYSTSISVINKDSLNNSKFNNVITGSSIETARTENIKNVNYAKNYEFIQTAGKRLNNRSGKPNKSVFQTRFSSVDHLSDIYKDDSGEYSIYNNLNNRAADQKETLNYSSSLGNEIQGENTSNNFRDNDYIQRNIPYTSSNYSNLNTVNYQNIPSEEVFFRHYTNLLIDENNDTYRSSKDIVEPPIQQNVALKQNLKIDSGFENIDIYSPYSAQIDDFSSRNLLAHNRVLQKHISGGYYPVSATDTVYNNIISSEKYFKFNKFEKLEVIFPRTDLIGLAQVRTKSPSYEEEVGSFQTQSLNTLDLLSNDANKINYWTDNSYNNNASKIRSFWRDSQEDRKRTNGIEADNLADRPETGSIGSFNCLDFPNRATEEYNFSLGGLNYYYHENNVHNSIHSMDANVEYIFNDVAGETYDHGIPYLSCSNEVYGELAPYSHFQLFNLTSIYDNDYIKIQPKISFTHNIYASALDNKVKDLYSTYSGSLLSHVDDINHVLNKSYQSSLDCRIKSSYDSYEDFRHNIKHKSQTHSIIPEFITSRYESVIKDQYVELFDEKIVTVTTYDTNDIEGVARIVKPIPNYLTINGGERYDQIRKEDFKVDLKNFIDKKSNKIKFNLNAVKKLLPYNGFYPQQRTPQLATIFSDAYLKDTGYVSDVDRINIAQSGDNNIGEDFNLATSRTLATMQPLFNPGILFNTIKAGIAMPWQTMGGPDRREDEKCADYNAFETGSGGLSNRPDVVYLKNISIKFPFEAILDPYSYYYTSIKSNDPISPDITNFDLSDAPNIPYLDPTHKTFYSYPTLKKWVRNVYSIKLFEHISTADDRLYKSAINNFLAETNNFFCANKFTSFSSAGKEKISVESGSVYSMDIVLQNNNNFSMFNKYSDNVFGIIPSASLFGPPIVPVEGLSLYSSSLDSLAYMPYAPCYFYNDRDILTLRYTADSTGDVSIQDIFNNLAVSYYVSGSGNELANKYRTSVYDSINYKLVSGSTWSIQTKFETPLFIFNNCSQVETGSVNMYYGVLPNRG